MKKIFNSSIFRLPRLTAFAFCILAGSALLVSFTIRKRSDDFLQQLGMSKSTADQKIANSILGGYLDTYGSKKWKAILPANRTAITNDLLAYTKEAVKAPEFKKQYDEIRNRQKPEKQELITPAAMKEEQITNLKKMLADYEAGLKKNPELNEVYTQLITDGKKQLALATDPKNEMFAFYEQNFPEMMKQNEELYASRMKEWEEKYPADPQRYVKGRLQEFLKETDNIAYNAQLVEKNGKKLFADRAYESKSSNWKMAFRAGKEVVEPARAFVKNWIKEIN